MALRPGSAEAKILFNKSCISSFPDWQRCVTTSNYQLALTLLACNRDTNDRTTRHLGPESRGNKLICLDKFINGKYISIVRDRNPELITLEDLSQVMQWKLLRGKARPLQALVDSNNPQHVIDASTRSFACMHKGKWTEAFNALTELRGVEATASAILSPLFPSCPFMADEVIDATCPTRKYDRKTYTLVRQQLTSKASELNAIQPDQSWTAESVGKALWTCAMISAYGQTDDQIYPTSSAASLNEEPKSTKKRKKPSPEKNKRIKTS